MHLKSIGLAAIIATLALTTSPAVAYWPSAYCRHHICVRPHGWRNLHCHWHNGRRHCWR